MDEVIVYIWPDNFQCEADTLEEHLAYRSDDYLVCMSAVCEQCHHVLEIDYDLPFATCDCGIQEWYKTR